MDMFGLRNKILSKTYFVCFILFQKQKFPHRAHWAETSCEIIRKKDGVFGKCVETMGSNVNDYYDHCVKDACRY